MDRKDRKSRTFPIYYYSWPWPYAFLQPQDFHKHLLARLRGLPGIIISTLPKSASAYIWTILSDGLNIAGCRIQVGHFPDTLLVPDRVKRLARGGCITQSHFGPKRHNLLTLLYYGVDRLVVNVRDPRQALLSWAHHMVERQTKSHPELVGSDVVPSEDYFGESFSDIISWHIENYLPAEVDWIDGWTQVSESADWSDLRILLTRFEDFKVDQKKYFQKILDFYNIDKDAGRFVKKEKPKEGQMHFRKGLTNEWQSVFSKEQIQRANEIVPRRLIERFGWPE